MPTAERLAKERAMNQNQNPNPPVDDDEMDEAELKRQRQIAATQAANFSVKADVPNQPKYMLTIAVDPSPSAVNPVPVLNGDFRLDIWRGPTWIVPECVVTVLNDAKGLSINPETRTGRMVPSYPFSAIPYTGKLPIGTAVDERGNKVDPNAFEHT